MATIGAPQVTELATPQLLSESLSTVSTMQTSQKLQMKPNTITESDSIGLLFVFLGCVFNSFITTSNII